MDILKGDSRNDEVNDLLLKYKASKPEAEGYCHYAN